MLRTLPPIGAEHRDTCVNRTVALLFIRSAQYRSCVGNKERAILGSSYLHFAHMGQSAHDFVLPPSREKTQSSLPEESKAMCVRINSKCIISQTKTDMQYSAKSVATTPMSF